MPVLNWIGKDAVVAHNAQVPFRRLLDVPEPACGDAYPDFLIRTQSGGIIAAEYKCAHLATGGDAHENKRIAELWERRSGGKCAFAWVEKSEWALLRNAAARCAAARSGF